ncbi:MAG: hypothetical protein HOQ34_19635 [Gemmatimonadaceae bacterium]|nr:hypothetical protein [Gemmatimonadaceae bacterium]
MSAPDDHTATTIRLEPERAERLRGLLVEFAIGGESAKHFDVDEMRTLGEDLRQMLGEISALRSEKERDARYIEKLEAADSKHLTKIIDLNTRLAAASRILEQVLQRHSIALQGATAEFNELRSIRDALDPSITTLPGGALLQRARAEHTEPRTAAGVN